MKKLLNWEKEEVANIFDEATLWSAPFGRLLLENIPMTAAATIVDIGFGTGFPLVELSQRFGDTSKIYGIDIWPAGIQRTQVKIDTLELTNIEILQESATKINLADDQIDLVTSNLGINNFDDKGEVYKEIKRILKPGGRLSLTTNPVGTFEELFALFHSILTEMKLAEEVTALAASIQRRNTEEEIISEFQESGFQFVKREFDSTNMRFVNAEALVNHSLIRIGFRESWEKMIRAEKRSEFFERLHEKVQGIIEVEGEFKISIPMLYLEFEKGGKSQGDNAL